MKKLLTIILLTATALFAIACSSSSVVQNAGDENAGQTMFERHTLDNDYSILIDKETGVCYLEYSYNNRYGITVLLNADGTPKIWKD